MRDVFVCLIREWHIGLKTPRNILIELIYPFMYLTIFAPTMAMVIGTVEWMGREVPYLTYVIPGIMAMSAVSVGNAAAINIYIDRLSGEMEIMFSLPIRRVAILAGYAANAVVRSLVSSIAFLAIALMVTPWAFTVSLSGVPGLVAIIALSAIGWSMFGATLAFSIRRQSTYNLVYNLIQLPIVFTSSMLYNPVRGPAITRWLGPVNPLTFATNALRACCAGTQVSTSDVVGLCVFTALTVLSASWVIGSSSN